MRRFALALTILAISVAAWPATQANAQETKKARGTLTAIAGNSVTVTVGTTEMKFSYDEKTQVEATGGGTQTRQRAAAGQPGPKLADILKTGQAVEVSYQDAGGGVLHATTIRRVSTPGSGGVPGNTSNGTVTAISATSLSIEGASAGGGTFTQTFTIDAKTNAIGKGLGTKTTATGGKAPVTDLVHNGDMVTVSHSPAGSALHADEVRVTSGGR